MKMTTTPIARSGLVIGAAAALFGLTFAGVGAFVGLHGIDSLPAVISTSGFKFGLVGGGAGLVVGIASALGGSLHYLAQRRQTLS